jgi:Holliday junction resolvase RusA-like endonuclease
MTSITFVCDIAPLSINRSYRVVRFGKRAGLTKTPDARTYSQHVRAGASVAVRHPRPMWCKGTEVSVSLRFYWPSRRGDVDGPVKQTLDALQGIVYANDSQVTLLTVERFTDKARPRVEIEVRERDVFLLLGGSLNSSGAVIPFPAFLHSYSGAPSPLHSATSAWEDAHHIQSTRNPLVAGRDMTKAGEP